jgi:hypothetical protein
VALGNILTGSQQQTARRLRHTRGSSGQAAPALLISGGTEQPLGDTLQAVVSSCAGRRKIVDHQERVFRMKCQRLESIGGRGKVRGHVGRIHRGPEVLLAKSSKSGLEHAAPSGEEHTKTRAPERGRVDCGKQRKADPVWRDT